MAEHTRTSGVAPREPEASPLAPTELVVRSSAPPPTSSARRVVSPSSSKLLASQAIRTPAAAFTPGAWFPRPLPAHVKGRCHARGTFPRAVHRWLERAYGKNALDAVLAMLPHEHANAFRSDAFNALVWHELEAVDMLMEAATAKLMAGDSTSWRKLARSNFTNDLSTILRPSSRLVDPPKLLERAATGWTRIFDFGKVTVAQTEKGKIALSVLGFEAASLCVRYVFVGTTEGLLDSVALPDANLRIVAGESNFARDLELELTWRE
jgi:hypothetical protein